MRRCHPVPTRWLMTDERLGADLWRALRRLPRGGGVVFRHHATPAAARRRLFRRVRAVALARGLVLLRAGEMPLPGEHGVHGRRRGAFSRPVHDRAEAAAARRAHPRVVMVSPVFATRSHPGAASLGPRAAVRLLRDVPGVRIALGGMDERKWRRLHGFHGWAGIDAWIGKAQIYR